MRNKFYIVPVLLLLLSICITPGKDADAQTEGFNIKTPIQTLAEDSESFVKELISDRKDREKEAVPENILCSAKCIVVLPNVKPINQRDDFKGTGLMSCLKTNSKELTPPIFYEINELTSFYEKGGNIIVFVTDKTGVESLLANSLRLTSDNSQAGPPGSGNNTKTSKSFVSYAKPVEDNLEGYDLSGSSLVYANRDTFNAYQETIVPVDILLYNQDIPPGLRGFNSAVKELLAVCE